MNLMLYFVSALIVAPPAPTGWLQHTKSYRTLESCQNHIHTHEPAIIHSIMKSIGTSVEIKKIKCLTYDQAVKLNTKLGH